MFVKRKYLKAISSVKRKILFWNTYIFALVISFSLHNNLIYKVWVDLIKERQHKI